MIPGCLKGTPTQTLEQAQMLQCCTSANDSDGKDDFFSSSEMSETCSNLYLLSITQVVCSEL
jgi:hypothetical protein